MDAERLLGTKVRDTVTGYEGKVTAVSVWLNGCVRVLIENKDAMEGTGREVWLDQERIEGWMVEETVPTPIHIATGGGKRSTPHRARGG